MLSFNNAVGNLFNIVGKCAFLVKNAKSNQTTQLTALTNTTTGLTAQLNSLPNVQTLIGSAYISQLNNAGQIGTLAQSVAQQALNTLVFNDNPRLAQTLTQLQIATSLQELIRQMKLAGASVLQAAGIAATPVNSSNLPTYPYFVGVGNGTITTSVIRPSDGLLLENIFAENLTLTCTSDSYSGNATAGNESFSVTGAGAETNFFAFDWPLGSNASTSLSAINGNASNSQGNGLTNSGFETFTSTNTPNNFVIEVGTPGTQVFKEATIVYDGVAALRLLGDGSNLTALSQTFGSSSGSTAQLAPQTQYSVNLFLRRDGTVAGAGTLVVELTDGNGVVIIDANNVPNTFSINLTTLTTQYAPYNSIFRTPVILPAAQKIRLRLSTALTSGRSVYLDKMSMGLPTQIYTSGPYVAVHAGSVPFAVGDYATVTVANTRGAAGTLSTFQTVFEQFFPMLQNGFLLPSSSSSPTISDSTLIA